MEKMIHIHAKCDQFEIFEIVPEKKCVQRLKTIRDMFKNRYSDKLVVKTQIHNPTLF